MTMPNIEELIAVLEATNQFHDNADICTADVIDVLQSQAERIAELERESETHSKAYGLSIVERDNLRHELKTAQEGWRCECSTDDACRFARERDAKAEHIKELEADFSRLEATAQKFCVRNTFVEAENDTLRAQLAAIAAAEPVAYRWVWKSKPHDIEGWCYTHTPPNHPELQEIEKLFTRPMPAQDVTELVEALEKLARLGNGEHYGNSDGNMIARDALSKYKGAK